MSLSPKDYAYYKEVFKGQTMPFAFVDLDLFDENVKQLAARAGSKQIRVASKSVRVAHLLKRVFDANPIYQGIMTFTAPEAVWLSKRGFDDLLMGYPIWHEQYITEICNELKKDKTIVLMIDSIAHVEHIERIGQKNDCVIPVCLDIDMSSDYPGIHFGVWRSSIFGKADAVKVAEKIKTCNHVKLDGIMGYEAQIAGLGDAVPGKAVMNSIISMLKKNSIKEIAKRREDIVLAIKEMGFNLRFVNGGGTGSMESTREEKEVTEITVGSGFFTPTLFDDYSNFKHLPAAGYAIEVVRQPKDGIYTCFGGGYIASGEVGLAKQPKVYLPADAKLTNQEGAGEVQTPVEYKGRLELGDPVFMRHSKAGELCERFNTVLLVSNGQVVEEIPTYRGEGQCFL